MSPLAWRGMIIVSRLRLSPYLHDTLQCVFLIEWCTRAAQLPEACSTKLAQQHVIGPAFTVQRFHKSVRHASAVDYCVFSEYYSPCHGRSAHTTLLSWLQYIGARGSMTTELPACPVYKPRGALKATDFCVWRRNHTGGVHPEGPSMTSTGEQHLAWQQALRRRIRKVRHNSSMSIYKSHVLVAVNFPRVLAFLTANLTLIQPATITSAVQSQHRCSTATSTTPIRAPHRPPTCRQPGSHPHWRRCCCRCCCRSSGNQ
jgi:hypothetical protein